MTLPGRTKGRWTNIKFFPTFLEVEWLWIMVVDPILLSSSQLPEQQWFEPWQVLLPTQQSWLKYFLGKATFINSLFGLKSYYCMNWLCIFWNTYDYSPIIGNWDPAKGNLDRKYNINIVHARKLTEPKIKRLRAAGNVQNVAKVKHDITEM